MAQPTPISSLPGYTRYITSHNDNGEAIIHSEGPGTWLPYEGSGFGFSIAYTTSEFPANLNDGADLIKHQEVESAGKNLGLVKHGGTICRVVDFSPGQPGIMHRTESLDFGVVLEGEIELVLDSGDTRLMKKGDIAVQRGTNHAWRNPNPTNWTRMMFVLQHCQPVLVNGTRLNEYLGGAKDIKPSQ
jgi:quercetin dioxygenase-like cupin family protein